jgi:hypothetical protein
MTRSRKIRLIIVVVALCAGLGTAAWLRAAGGDKVRARDALVRVAFAAAPVSASQSAPARYEAQVRDLTRSVEELVSPLTFTRVAGPVDSHVVWLTLDYYHSYLVRVRGTTAGGVAGPWSDWSDPYENASPWATPEPPGD